MTTNATTTSAASPASSVLFAALKPGDRVEVGHVVTIGSSAEWSTRTVGTVVRNERRRHGLHFRRNPDDKVYSDVIMVARDDGELTTVTMDEFTKLPAACKGRRSAASRVPCHKWLCHGQFCLSRGPSQSWHPKALVTASRSV